MKENKVTLDKKGTADISLVCPNPDQPRKLFRQDALEELALSIRGHGVLEPIVLTPDGMIIAGERRWRASLLEGTVMTDEGPKELQALKRIPAIIKEADARLIEELALIENIQREDLTPLEEAREFQRLISERGWTKEELARTIGKKQSWRIDERLSLLNLAPEYQEMLLNGDIGNSQAFEMSRVPAAKQGVVLRRILSGELNTYNRLRAFVDGMIALESQGNVFEFQPISEEERKTISTLDRALKGVEGFIREVYDQGRADHLRRAGYRAEISVDRIDLLIKGLQRIRKDLLAGKGMADARAA